MSGSALMSETGQSFSTADRFQGAVDRASWRAGRRTLDVPCKVDLEQTGDFLHAHVELLGWNVGPGDEVLIHDAPHAIAFGERAVFARRATVRRAGLVQRALARIRGYLELTELYEVSFSEGRAR